MNDMNSTGTCRWPARHALVLLILLGLLVLTQLIRAWLTWQHETGSFRQVRVVAGHELVAVTLTSGQVYYGNLEAAGNEYLRIGGIYYVQREDAQNGSPPQFHLINRKKSDWHACAFHGNRPGIPSETGHPVHLNSATRSEATQGVGGIYS